MGILQKIREHRARGKESPVMIDVCEIASSRAIYQGKDRVPLVHLHITLPENEKIILEMNYIQAREVIEELTHIYYAIIPPIRNKQSAG